jgi:acid phosphatase (class A)
MARAARYGESRLVCEVHYRSDVTAGEALGLIVAERLMAKPSFRLQFNRARAELARAGILS